VFSDIDLLLTPLLMHLWFHKLHTLKKIEESGNMTRKHYNALCVELTLEKTVDL